MATFNGLHCAAVLWLAGATAAHAQTLSETKDEITYTIRKGDTLIGLGKRYFVSPESYKTVERLNGFTDPSKMRVGAKIIIPTNLLKHALQSAKVIALKGQANVQRGGKSVALAINSQVSEGAVIQTAADGFLTLQLANGSRVAMPSNSRVRILRMRTFLLTSGTDTDFAVEKGRTETTAVPLRDNRSRFRVRTPVAVSAVRGTVFRIGYDGPDTPSLTEVVEGSVAVDVKASGANTILPTAFGAAAAASGKLEKEELLPPPEFAAGGQQQRGSDVIFGLVPNPGAVGYHVQIATDAKFIDIVSSARARDALVNLGSLPNGNYYARAMAIAPSGLEGLPQPIAFSRKLEALNSGKLSESKGGYRLGWDLGKVEKAVYRLQLFGDANPSIPIIDEPGLTQAELMVYGLEPGRYSWRIGRLKSVQGKIEQYWTPFEIFVVEK